MTDTQLLTIVIAIAAPFLGTLIGVLMNSHRLNDIKEVFTAQLETRASSKELSALQIAMAELRSLVERNHSEMLVKIAELENRKVRP